MAKEKKKDNQSNDESSNDESLTNEELTQDQLTELLAEEFKDKARQRNESTRLECLKLAVDVSRTTTSEVIKSAKEMFKFVKG